MTVIKGMGGGLASNRYCQGHGRGIGALNWKRHQGHWWCMACYEVRFGKKESWRERVNRHLCCTHKVLRRGSIKRNLQIGVEAHRRNIDMGIPISVIVEVVKRWSCRHPCSTETK